MHDLQRILFVLTRSNIPLRWQWFLYTGMLRISSICNHSIQSKSNPLLIFST